MSGQYSDLFPVLSGSHFILDHQPRIARRLQDFQHSHLLHLNTLNPHATHNIRKQRHHIIIAHGHIGDNLLQRNLLARKVLVLLAAALRQLETQLGHFALLRASP